MTPRDITDNTPTDVLSPLGGHRWDHPHLQWRPRTTARDDARPHLILFLAANPCGSNALRLAEECAEIQRELKMTPHRDDFRFEARWAVSIDELMRHLTELDPSVIHFSGHGGGHGGLLLQNEQGEPQVVSLQSLAQILNANNSRARVVVLNACYSASQAAALSTAVDCVIGMDGAIDDSAARIFAARFYAALGNRSSIGKAVALGVAALAARELPDEAMPGFVTRAGVDANELVFEPVGSPPRDTSAPVSSDPADELLSRSSGSEVHGDMELGSGASEPASVHVGCGELDARGVAAAVPDSAENQVTIPRCFRHDADPHAIEWQTWRTADPARDQGGATRGGVHSWMKLLSLITGLVGLLALAWVYTGVLAVAVACFIVVALSILVFSISRPADRLETRRIFAMKILISVVLVVLIGLLLVV